MAKGNRTTSTPRRATAAKATAAVRPHVTAMDKLNQAFTDLAGTVRALHAVDMDGPSDADDAEICRATLMRLVMADLGLVEAAERTAWRTIIGPGKGPDAIDVSGEG